MARSQQLALPIGTVEPPEHLLREAYRRSRIKQSFDDAMKLTHLRIGIRHMAMLMAATGRRRKGK